MNGKVHCISTDTGGYEVVYWNFDGTNFSRRIFLLTEYCLNENQGKFVPKKYTRNATKGADLTVSYDGEEITIATLHPACNILLHKGTFKGSVWADDFFEGLTNGSVIALFDTTNSATGDNIPNNDPKPYTEVQVCYDANDNLHVIYDATYQDIWIDTASTLPWDTWWATYSSMAGDTNVVFYDGTEHPKPQLRYWNSITKTHSLLAECHYPMAGKMYKWFSYGIPDSGRATWGKYINDSPIANIEFLVNKDPQEGEPKLVCVWEEMQGDVQALADTNKVFGYTYYAYMTDIWVSVSDDGMAWTPPYNITNTPDRDESDVSVYRDVIDNKIHMVYSEDRFPGSDRNLVYADDYEDKYLQGWVPVKGQFSVPIRKETTEPVHIVYRDFDLTKIPTSINSDTYTPSEFDLAQNYPNPFNPITTISYTVPGGRVKLDVYNVLGQKIKTLVDKDMLAGSHQVVWDGTNDAGNLVSTGLYICKIKSEAGIKTKKMLLQK